MTRNLLVTGGAGFIGSNFIHYLQTHTPEIEIYNLDLLTYAGRLENLDDLPVPGKHHFIRGSICDAERVESILKDHQISTIVHFAAESHVDRSLKNPGAFIDTNVVGTHTLLEAACKVWEDQPGKHRFHHISTDEVFGSLRSGEPAFTEKTPYAPNSPYAASKAASDHLVRAYGKSFGLPYSISNTSNNYGPFQFPEKLIPLLISNALAGKPLPIYGDGKQIRDWLYVEDHCTAIWTIIEKGQPGKSYNVGGNNQTPNIKIVELICSILDEKVPDSPFRPHQQLIQFVKDRPGHDRRYAIDSHLIQEELGWEPQNDLRGGLEKTVDWYLAHTDWLKAIQQGTSYQDWIEKNYQERGRA